MSDEIVLTIDPPYIGSAVSPEVNITETTNDVTVTITDFRGDHSYTVEKTEQAIADAEQAATNANNAATQATETANAAAQYARDTADQAAADAQETADEAAGRADTAAASATQAASNANSAATSASEAASNANTKANLAEGATANANAATERANTAAANANSATAAAQTAAEQATTAATNATTAAGTANTAAGNAEAKAQLADTAATNAQTATANANTATTNATNAAQAANNAADYAIEAADDMPKLIGTVDTVQTVTDAWPTTPESATLYGKCVQDGTPTPDNPVEVQVVGGRNLLETTFAGSVTSSGVTATKNNDGSITLSGTASGVGTWALAGANPFTDTLFTLAPGTYTLSLGGAFSQSCMLSLLDWPNSKTVASINGTNAKKTFTLTEEANVTYIRFQAYSGTYDKTIYPQLEAGTQATPYVPYGCAGLQLGDSVLAVDLQGHTLPEGDVLRIDSAGRVTIDASAKKLTGQDFNVWTVTPQSDGTVSFVAATDVKTGTMPTCNVAYVGGPNTGKIVVSGNALYMRFAQSVVGTTTEQIKAWLAANCELYYESTVAHQTIDLGYIELPDLTQPCTLAFHASLDPEWSITYEQDPNAVITSLQASIAPVESGTASTNYSVNSYLIQANQLYRVTSAIATGEAITPGTNCVACTVMGEVIRLTA